MSKKQNLIWIDLEMTGLYPDVDHILEVMVVVTDNELNVLHEGPHLVIHQPESIIEAMGPWCTEHHERSGLTDAVRASTVTIEQAQEETLAVIKQFCDQGKGILAGNSVWQDRLFLVRFMPKVIDYLNYRLLDVSSVKEAIARWYPNDSHIRFKKSSMHRAFIDIHESIAELAHYKKHFFK